MVACHQIMSQERVTGSAHSAKTLIFTGGKSATNAKPPLLEVEAVEVAEDEVVGVGKKPEEGFKKCKFLLKPHHPASIVLLAVIPQSQQPQIIQF